MSIEVLYVHRSESAYVCDFLSGRTQLQHSNEHNDDLKTAFSKGISQLVLENNG